MTKWQQMEAAVLGWLAGTATGSIVKVSLGGGLAWLLVNLPNFDIPAWLAASMIPAVPVIINALNPADGRYGKGKTVLDDDPDLDDEVALDTP